MNHTTDFLDTNHSAPSSQESLTPSQELFSDSALYVHNDTDESSEEQGNENKHARDLRRSYHPQFVRKKSTRVRILLTNGKNCIGNCHVLWPDGRVSDVVNDDRPFLIITDASVEGEQQSYNVLTLNKSQIAMLFEIHNKANVIEELA